MSSMIRCIHRFAQPALRFSALALLVLAGTACDRQPTATMPAPEDTTKEVAPKIVIQYPSLANELGALDQAMHAWGDAARKKFATDVAAHSEHAAAPPPRLNIDFAVATRTQDFVSALATGEADMGDAKAQPFGATFTEHLPSARIVVLSDLFTDPDAALKALSVEARRRLDADAESRLRQENFPEAQLSERLKAAHAQIEQGTLPNAQNFSSFLIDGVDGKAIGLSLQFAPGQVAANALGTQQLEVPARIFYAQLKSEYRDAFAVDKEDLKPAETAPAAPK
jgi:hypothetical protein